MDDEWQLVVTSGRLAGMIQIVERISCHRLPYRVGFRSVGETLNTEALKAIRQRSGMSQVELAARAGVPQDALSRIESGKRKATPAQVRALASALHVSIPAILKDAK